MRCKHVFWLLTTSFTPAMQCVLERWYSLPPLSSVQYFPSQNSIFHLFSCWINRSITIDAALVGINTFLPVSIQAIVGFVFYAGVNDAFTTRIECGSYVVHVSTVVITVRILLPFFICVNRNIIINSTVIIFWIITYDYPCIVCPS